jgi:N-acetylmuramoyl-L-alanine amidase
VASLLERIERLEAIVFPEQFEFPEPEEGNEEGDLARDVSGASRAPVSQERKLEQFIDGLGLRFFAGSEFTPYWSRARNGVRNGVPPESTWDDIVRTLVIMDKLRADLRSPIHVLSTYRSPDYNRVIGGERNSWHTKFNAIDFTCGTASPARWSTILKSYRGQSFRNPVTGTDFTFRGGIGIYPNRSFVHIDTRGNDANWSG